MSEVATPPSYSQSNYPDDQPKNSSKQRCSRWLLTTFSLATAPEIT
jgi:hypothetical protein